ncbi:MAG: T9SS type B sorting domain-containing protein, partial [Bacteroidia bacterium]
MSYIFRLNYLTALLISFLICASSFAQLAAHAGPDKIVCPGSSALLGGSPAASGGLAPYTYSWSPAFALNSTTLQNPTCTPTTNYGVYTLTVTDDTGAVATDQVSITLNYIANVSAGNDTSICVNSHALLGGDLNVSGAGVTYSWAPSTFLDNSNLPRPTCTPLTSSMSYTLTATPTGCPVFTDVVNVTVIPTPLINAGPDVTIQEGEVAVLNASGGYYYAWSPQATLTYPYTANPDAEPIVTTTYYLYGTDLTNKCAGYDSVVVTVITNDAVVFYNTFTPNNDGNNDTWYIGNIEKYPDNKLEIYNRDGKVVFKANSYLNNWNGKAFGQELPAGTYFYVMDLGDNKGTRHGT